MKILFRGIDPSAPPKKKIRLCRFCGSLLKIEQDDFRAACNMLGEDVWAVDCPVCGGGLIVCKR